LQAYGRGFARAYNLRWGGLARQVGPYLAEFYARTPAGQARQPVLDLCCGTGLVGLRFLEQGYQVTGLDLSAYMLAYAAQNAAAYVRDGRANFVQGDAAQFALDGGFGMAVATYDALNHLADFAALRGCFRSAHSALTVGGWFIFDLNTRRGLRRWQRTSVDDSEEAVVFTRGLLDEDNARATLNITGFLRTAQGTYERFDETVFNTIFDVQPVLWTLLNKGWSSAHAARFNDLASPLDEPEQEERVFIVAQRA
jgi:SAM-dependent methyltransferase